eukprot:573538-Pyramimonas_sp.AAC.1
MPDLLEPFRAFKALRKETNSCKLGRGCQLALRDFDRCHAISSAHRRSVCHLAAQSNRRMLRHRGGPRRSA